MELAADVTGGDPEHVPHLAVDHDDVAIGVDSDSSERSRLKGEVPELALPANLAHLRAAGGIEPDRHRLISGHGRAGSAAENPLPHADDLEPLAVRQQHLGLAEEKVTALAQREVETVDDLGLGLDIEVHQRVAADQQVQARDRGITGDVVAAEDHPAAQVRAEGELGAVLLEVFAPQLGRQPFEGLRRVEADPGVAKGIFVDIGAVDLDPFGTIFDPQRLGEGDRQRVRLLAAGAASAPHPDLAFRVNIRQQLGHDLPLQEGPRLRIAEESGHVDQNRVEQVTEFLSVALQLIPVLYVICRSGLVHPLADSPCQG